MLSGCPMVKEGQLNVHVVPHSHMELGMAKKFEEHFSGEHEVYAKSEVNAKRILDATIAELWGRKERKFTISGSELPYFFHWWARRDETVRRMVYELIRQGRLVIIGGGWGMSDEATTYYQAIIDSYTYSLRKINATFLSCGRPLVAWQADTLGHSREFASLIAQMGFDALFINPISFDDEIIRMSRKGLEFLWRGSDDLGVETDIFTHKLFDGYWSPPGFCFDIRCSDPLLISSDSVFNNIEERVDAFIRNVRERQGPSYGTNHLMVMMGKKFAYFTAKLWFENTDKLIQSVNAKTSREDMNIHVTYSTPACYLKEVHASNITLETKQDDFLPFAYDKHSYVSGFYTSRPSLKYYIKESNIYFQIVKQLQVFANMGNYNVLFEDLSWLMAIVQDHSIITGAMVFPVFQHYMKRIYETVQRAMNVLNRGINKLRKLPPEVLYFRCYFNESSCPNTRVPSFHIIIYNPLAWPVTMPIRVPVYLAKYLVFDPDGDEVHANIIPTPKHLKKLQSRYESASYELVFIADKLPALGFRSYYIIEKSIIRQKKSIIKKINKKSQKYFLRQASKENTTNMDDVEYEYFEYDRPEPSIDFGNITRSEDANYFDYTNVVVPKVSYENNVVTPADNYLGQETETLIPIESDSIGGRRSGVREGGAQQVHPEVKIKEDERTQNLYSKIKEMEEKAQIYPKEKELDERKENQYLKITETEDKKEDQFLKIPETKNKKEDQYPKIKETERNKEDHYLHIPGSEAKKEDQYLHMPGSEAKKEDQNLQITGTEEKKQDLYANIMNTEETKADLYPKSMEIEEKNNIFPNITEIEDKNEVVYPKITQMEENKDDTDPKIADIDVTKDLYPKLTDEDKNEAFSSRTQEAEVKKPQDVFEDETIDEKKILESNIHDPYYFKESSDTFIENKYIKIYLDEYRKVTNITLSNGIEVPLDIQYYYYVSDEPRKTTPEIKKTDPGVYIFRPMDKKAEAIIDFINTKVYKNELVQEIHSSYSDWASFVLRLYTESPVVEVDWMIGPVPIDDGFGKEVFLRYTTDLENRGIFYTDSNGRQTIKRIKNVRAMYEPYNLDPIAGNFYPVTSRIYIEDLNKNIRFSVFNDRSQGGASLIDGCIDLMVQRRILTDDLKVNIFLNTTINGTGIIIRGTHYLYFTKANYKQNKVYEKKFAKEIELKPQVIVSSVKDFMSRDIWYRFYNEFSALKTKLPIGVHVLSLQEWNEGTLLLRLENYLEKADVVRTGIKIIFLKQLFVNLKIYAAKETTLAGNMWLDDWMPLQWSKKDKFVKNYNKYYFEKYKQFSDDTLTQLEYLDIDSGVSLIPQQIRTFVIWYQYM